LSRKEPVLGLPAADLPDLVLEIAAKTGSIRTTQIYVDVTDQRKADGIAALERGPHPLAA